MNLLFLHIGDIHIKDISAINAFQIDKIADALNTFEWDRMILFITGDIAFSGKSQQYRVAKQMVGKLVDSIKKRCHHSQWIDTICVPGNHDVYQKGGLSSKDLQNIRASSTYEEHFCDELEKQKAFYTFAHNYRCFSEVKPVDRRILSYGAYKVEINLVNSALFSIIEEDKGLHYIPSKYISEIDEPTHADFVITLMHHSPDWFVDSQKNRIEEIVYGKSSIVMFGHEHYIAKKQ